VRIVIVQEWSSEMTELFMPGIEFAIARLATDQSVEVKTTARLATYLIAAKIVLAPSAMPARTTDPNASKNAPPKRHTLEGPRTPAQ
jgi:hypothetical protein